MKIESVGFSPVIHTSGWEMLKMKILGGSVEEDWSESNTYFWV